MNKSNWLRIISIYAGCFLPVERAVAQDLLPVYPPQEKVLKVIAPLRDVHWTNDTIAVQVTFPSAFQGMGQNEIVDSIGLLDPVFEHLRQTRANFTNDTVSIVHIGDSHVRGHIYPQTVGARLAETFGAVVYTDMGINGATCLTFTNPDRITAVAALNPELLILSFGTNESHNRRYDAREHYSQMDELIKLLRNCLPDIPILLTTPPGSFDSIRQRRRTPTYSVNPRTAVAAETIRRYACNNRLLVWDLYEVVGGQNRACTNWMAANLMRPDHVHYLPEGYVLQGNLLYQALIKAYNDYISE